MAGIYVHIPFCASRCSYCDFYSTLSLSEAGDAYVTAVLAEASMRRKELRCEPVKTLYLGGGTPSQLPVPLLERLVTGLKSTFDLSKVEEFTIEANPDDVSSTWCDALLPLGVNRVSMGVQSFENHILKAIGRRHDAMQVGMAVHTLRWYGIDNISIDLIYGLPGQTLESWEQSVEKTLEMKPEHISAYSLTYEPGTRLWKQLLDGEVTEVPEAQCVEMYRILVDALLSAGYEHYEISNFALPGYHSRHNSSYWDGTPYLGLGAAAHSYDGSVRRNNPCDLEGYIKTIYAGRTAYDQEEMKWWERYDERVMLGLRTAHGVDVQRLREDFGLDAWLHFIRKAQRYLEAGLLEREGENMYAISDKGIMVSDAIIRDLMWDV